MSSGTSPTGAVESGHKRIGRPRRLTTPEVIDQAISLADDQGLGGLSMPALAKHLGVGTMTLYGYVENKEDLLDKVAARLFADLELSSHERWQNAMFSFFSGFREAAIAHPTLARLLADGRITIPAVFDILETLFGEMTDEGVPIDEAIRLFYSALTYTIGFVLWEIPRVHLQPEGAYADQWTDLISELDDEAYPILTGSAAETATTVATVVQFNWGLSRILGYQPAERR
jgi:TetR/AcrR family tetracycline transcriptional repressor